tara:strand:- start:134 stop:406 length:273 start_codon:yes stop_codon:yes gene_type:complete
MIINSFELTNLILDKKALCVVENKYFRASLVLTDEKPTASVGWGAALTVRDFHKPFIVNHPVYKKYTFKLIDPQQHKRQGSLLEWMLSVQ